MRPLADGTLATQGVEEHLRGVAALAEQFADAFGSGDWARVAGLWHDLGKYHPEFQAYIRRVSGYDPEAHVEGAPGRVDHSTLGALYAQEAMGGLGRILAYVIAGHHAGLPDWESAEQGNATVVQRCSANRERLPAVLAEPVPEAVRSPAPPTSRPPGGSPALWIRMLFSALVDADFLDTEVFMDPERGEERGAYPSLPELHARFDAFMEAKAAAVLAKGPLSDVNRARAEVLRQCRERAALPPGLFSLTVPTGGGKTLSSLAWALEHARIHEKRRIIYVIPYTSIIEQTADVFRAALGDAVVEHHSNLEPDRETSRSRLASENWDASVIVTTGVQFWESLFAARTSRARKLHNIVNSVVVLDEAQTLPPDFLLPILGAMRDLQASYGVSFLLCTATQPALEERRGFDWKFPGLTGVREIIDRPDHLHDTLKRVELEVPSDLRTPVTWEALAAEMAEEHAVLCIVNRRDDARDLFQLLPPESRVHLSALMCGKHRSRTLRRIRKRLTAGHPIHVVSTQLVEAGVDLDFPVVYRALAGLDSIAQAAGRCNREGALARGRVVVFVPPRAAPVGLLKMAEEGGRRSLEAHHPDPLSPQRFRAYFEELYWKHGARLDRHGILELLAHGGRLEIRFRTAAEKFRLIDDAQLPVLVRHRNHDLLRRLGEMKRKGWEPDRRLRRELQRFVVGIPRGLHRELAASAKIAEWLPGVWVQESTRMYDPEVGFVAGDPVLHEAADLIA
ncbi:MAG: CRISPR-associated endonuclease Cas3'' [Gemmatimonadota bacterium]|nr:CRISPR-associated endonuclease Cas3'' [Gemmatimonadota bacterium]